jgi:RimJ/RimL family protein N-acetyltransferase
MDPELLTGSLVRLAADDPQTMSEALSRWGRDSEYWRLLASDPARLYSVQATRDWLEQEGESPSNYMFSIYTLEDNRLIGRIGLDGIVWNHAESFVGISLGERGDWGKGYGTDAMRILLRYAFTELNLHRVSLDVFEYNPRAIHSYEKVGFKVEGRVRQFLNRDGQRWDMIFMGILRDEWLIRQNNPGQNRDTITSH